MFHLGTSSTSYRTLSSKFLSSNLDNCSTNSCPTLAARRDTLVPPPDDHCPFPDGANIVAGVWFREPYLFNGASRPICRSTARRYDVYEAFSFSRLNSVISCDGTADLPALAVFGMLAFAAASPRRRNPGRQWNAIGSRAHTSPRPRINNQPGMEQLR